MTGSRRRWAGPICRRGLDLYTALVLRLAVVALLYSVCRLGFYVYHRDSFPGVSRPAVGHDARRPAVRPGGDSAWTNLPFILLSVVPLRTRHRRGYQRALGILFLSVNGIALSINCADFVRYPYILQRSTALALEEFANEPQLAWLVLRFMLDFWGVTLFTLALLCAMVLLYRRVKVSERPPVPDSFADGVGERRRFHLTYYATRTAAMLLAMGLTAAAARGGFGFYSHRPITNSNAGKYVQHPAQMAIVLNTPFSVIRTIDKKPLRRVHYYATEKALEAVYSPIHLPPATERDIDRQGRGRGRAGGDNIVVIILESFSHEHVGGFHRGGEESPPRTESFTPFLDSLMERSLVFNRGFANGRKSIDALPSITASIPSIAGPFVLSHHYSNRFESMASLLKRRGYRSFFFHGARNGSMGLDAFAKMAGFDAYFGATEYHTLTGRQDGYDGSWGIWDEEFFQFFASRLAGAKEPFLAVIFSLSSHHPYPLPARYEQKLRGGPHPLQKSIGYTDHALRRFFAEASTMPWFSRTLFVITADHAAGAVRPEYRTMVGRFRVPIILHRPGDETLRGYVDDRVVQHADIMPTVLRHVGVHEPFLAFGNDLLGPRSASGLAVTYRGDTYQLPIRGDYALHFDGVRTVGLYDYVQDPN